MTGCNRLKRISLLHDSIIRYFPGLFRGRKDRINLSLDIESNPVICNGRLATQSGLFFHRHAVEADAGRQRREGGMDRQIEKSRFAGGRSYALPAATR